MGTLAEYTTQLDSVIAAQDNWKAKALLTDYKKYVVAKAGAAGTEQFDTWLASAEGQKSLDNAITDSATGKPDNGFKASTLAAAKDAITKNKLNELPIKPGTDQPSGLGAWLGKNWPMLAAIAAPLLVGATGMFESIWPALLIGAGTIGLAAFSSTPGDGSILDQGMQAIGIRKPPEVTPPGTTITPPGTTLAPRVDPAVQAAIYAKAKAQEELIDGRTKIVPTLEPAETDGSKPVTLVVSALSDPSVVRTFKGKLDKNGDLTINGIMVEIEGSRGGPSLELLKVPYTFKGVTNDIAGSTTGEKTIDTDKLAKAKSEPVTGGDAASAKAFKDVVAQFGKEETGMTNLDGTLLQNTAPMKAKVNINAR